MLPERLAGAHVSGCLALSEPYCEARDVAAGQGSRCQCSRCFRRTLLTQQLCSTTLLIEEDCRETEASLGNTMPATDDRPPPRNESRETEEDSSAEGQSSKPSLRRLWFFGSVLLLDLVVSLVLLTPLVPWIGKVTGETWWDHDRFQFYASLLDLAALAFLRLGCCVLGLLVAYCRAEVDPEYPFELYHPNGDKKTREELEAEELEESFTWVWFRRFVVRIAFPAEVVSLVTQLDCVVKCLWRMNIEIGTLQDEEHYHPVFWLAILSTAVLSVLEACYLHHSCQEAAKLGKTRMSGNRQGILRTISSTLSIPLLAAGAEEGETHGDEDVEENGSTPPDTEVRGVSDITADSDYKARWSDLIHMCAPDWHLLCFAFLFLLLAAISQTLIPLYLGHILDSLSNTFVNNDDDATNHESMLEVPGFVKNMKLLVLVSVAAGVFSGLRGTLIA